MTAHTSHSHLERPHEDINALIIGAGPSGLAVAACLRKRAIPFLLLERDVSIGSSWRRHYDRLHLHTTKQHSALPHLPFPDDFPRYVPRDQFVDYLEHYAETFNIRPRTGQNVASAIHREGHWIVETETHTFTCRNLIIATGHNRVPVRPSWPNQSAFSGTVIHSSQYRSGEPFSGQRVMVVGAGNSGAEIALDLWEHGARPMMCVRNPVHVIPREIFGIPSQHISLLVNALPPKLQEIIVSFTRRFILEDLSSFGLPRPAISPKEQVERLGKIPLIDIGTVDLIKQGAIEVTTDIVEFYEHGVLLKDGTTRELDAVVCATGYKTGLSDFLEDAPQYLNTRGLPKQSGHELTTAEDPEGIGLYFVGYANPITGALRESGIEAARIAARIQDKGLNRASYPTGPIQPYATPAETTTPASTPSEPHA